MRPSIYCILAVAFLGNNIAAAIIRQLPEDIEIATPALEATVSDSPTIEQTPVPVPTPDPGASDHGCQLTSEGVCSTTPGPETWGGATCTNEVVISAGTDPTIRWAGVYADDAWRAVIGSWSAYKGPLSFPEYIGDFFSGPDNMKCQQTLILNGCGNFIQCDEVRKGPAGWLIINSMIALNNLIMNFYNGLYNVDLAVAESMSQMQKDFAPIPKDNQQATKIILDIIGMGFVLFAAPTFNMALKGLKWSKDHPDGFGTIKDLSTGLTSSGITLIKDQMPAPNAPAIAGDLRSKVIAIIKTWRDSTAKLQSSIFSGSYESIIQIHSLISDGKLLATAFTGLTDPEIQHTMERALFTILIPVAWVFAPDHAPFIINSQTSCNKPSDYGVSEGEFSRKLQAMSAECYNDSWYYISSAAGPERECRQAGPGGPVCDSLAFSVPPGMDKLDGKQWAGINKRDLIVAAVNTWSNHGFKNGAEFSNPQTSTDNRASLQTAGLLAPGIVTIPVCSIEEARANWKTFFAYNRKSDNYPCN